MKRASYVLVVGAFLVAVAAPGVFALTSLNDTFENNNLGVASQPNPSAYTGGADGQGVSFAAADSYIQYASDYFGAQGTISLFLKADQASGTTILDTIGASGASQGELVLYLRSDNKLLFQIYDGGWHYLVGSSVMSADDFNHVAISYGSLNGMKLYVNGVSEGTYLSGNYFGSRNGKNVYLGDCPLDGASYQWALSGGIDTLRTSGVECDENLIYGAATPEPGSLLALATGLLGSVAVLRRRRK